MTLIGWFYPGSFSVPKTPAIKYSHLITKIVMLSSNHINCYIERMQSSEYHTPEQRGRLFKYTLLDLKSGVRDHAMLRLMYGIPIRPIELCRLLTSDLATTEGLVLPDRHRVIRHVIAFNGKERPLPVLDGTLIIALQEWLEWRKLNGWGVDDTGELDMAAPFFLQSENVGFSVLTTRSGGVKRNNADSVNRIVRKRLHNAGLLGSVESTLKTWTIERHSNGSDHRLISEYRGDNDQQSVKRIVRGYTVRHGSLVECVY